MDDKEILVAGDELLPPIKELRPPEELITPIEEEDDNIDVLKLAKPNCKHCHGRGIVGYNVVDNEREEVMCSCIANRVERMERASQKMQMLLEEQKKNG